MIKNQAKGIIGSSSPELIQTQTNTFDMHSMLQFAGSLRPFPFTTLAVSSYPAWPAPLPNALIQSLCGM